ncbi:hypothetical protein GIB67_022890 [Kingdonia uniflora]|uniref:Uncharacterized protein n=1 Tax=Kingdonia uniflora TaxID=39325 RepID=A0A7J7MWA3_9MAGN|nr:hypothetical protein GIB67_022890 [Kingdonia uniflora]
MRKQFLSLRNCLKIITMNVLHVVNFGTRRKRRFSQVTPDDQEAKLIRLHMRMSQFTDDLDHTLPNVFYKSFIERPTDGPQQDTVRSAWIMHRKVVTKEELLMDRNRIRLEVRG